jgi:hypothetical protein
VSNVLAKSRKSKATMFTKALDYVILFGLATVFDAVVFMLRLMRPSGRSKPQS